jgi:hypothetical protein
MDGSSDRVGIIAVHACAPEVAFKHDMLALPRPQEKSWYSDGKSAVDRILVKPREFLGFRSITKLVIQRGIWLRKLGSRFVKL